MAFVADLAAIGSMVMVAFFALWMFKQLLAGSK
jgi:hypothetical protein